VLLKMETRAAPKLSEQERRERALGHECPDCGGLIQIVPATVMHEAHEEGEVARRCVLCYFICYIGDDPLHYSLDDDEDVDLEELKQAIEPVIELTPGVAKAFEGFNKAVERVGQMMSEVLMSMSIPAFHLKLPDLTTHEELEKAAELIDYEEEDDGDSGRHSDM
jgi:uncharacterized protein YoaH (UPF0181 family)